MCEQFLICQQCKILTSTIFKSTNITDDLIWYVHSWCWNNHSKSTDNLSDLITHCPKINVCFKLYFFFHFLVSADGRIAFSEIQTFLKKQHVISTRYKSVMTSLNKTISLTGNHLIYAWGKMSWTNFIPCKCTAFLLKYIQAFKFPPKNIIVLINCYFF